MNRYLSNLSGTLLTTFKIKLASLVSSSLTVARTFTLPDKSGTFAMLDDVINQALTGLSASAGTLAATDTILGAFNKVAGLIDNAAWTSYTPTVGSQSGSLTTVTAVGKYKRIGKTVFINAKVTLTNVGTATGYLTISMPVSAVDGLEKFSGMEDVNTGKMLSGRFGNSTTLVVRYYDNTSPIATNNVITITGLYEAA